MRAGHEAAGQRTTKDLIQLAQRQGLVCALSKTKGQRSIGEIPDILARWRRSVQLASAVGAGAVVAAARAVAKKQLGEQRRRTMRGVAMRWARAQQIVARCNVRRWGQQVEPERGVV